MSLSQLNNLLKDEFEYRLAFLTIKNGKSMRRLSTCKVVNLQFSFFSTPIWLERIFICFITPIMHLIARLSSFFAKKLRRSEIIFVSLLTAQKFYLYSLAIIKILIFCELYKLQSLFYSKITLNHACEFSLAKLQYFYDMVDGIQTVTMPFAALLGYDTDAERVGILCFMLFSSRIIWQLQKSGVSLQQNAALGYLKTSFHCVCLHSQ